MKYNVLVWYSNLAMSVEDNNFVSNFLQQSCKIIKEEINHTNQNRYEFNLEYLHIDKGEQGLQQLFTKLDTYEDYFFTNAHSIKKHNTKILEHLSNRNFFYFPQQELLDTNINNYLFSTSRVDRKAKMHFIIDEIKEFKERKVYFMHNEMRLAEPILNTHKSLKYFQDHSFKEIKDEVKIRNKIKKVFSKLQSDELIILDLNLKQFREVFLFLEENGFKNKVINTFGSTENRFKKISFNLIQL